MLKRLSEKQTLVDYKYRRRLENYRDNKKEKKIA